jgi:anti-sigma factor RsiW
MLTKINNQDMALLSAYLDGEVTEDEHKQIVARLEREAELRAALVELRQLKGAIRSMPTAKLPRHFTLGPEYERVSWRTKLGLSNSWGLASAAASFLLILVFAGEVLSFGNPLVAGEPSAIESLTVSQDEAFAAAAPEQAQDSAQEAQAVEEESFSSEDLAASEADGIEPKANETDALEIGEIEARSSDRDVLGDQPKSVLLYFRWTELFLLAIALASLWKARKKPKS